MIKNASSNIRRFALIDKLEEAAKEQNDTQMETWCEEQRENIVQSLRPVTKDDIDWLIGITKKRGAPFLQDV